MAGRAWICTRCYTRAEGDGGTCSACNATELVPVDSPRGRQLEAANPPVPAFRPPPPKIVDGAFVCSSCYTIATPKQEGPGIVSALAMIATGVCGIFFWPLWILTLLFLIYIAVGQKKVCKGCGAQGTLVPGNTPKASELAMKKLELETRR